MTEQLILRRGRGWHVRVGPLLVAHHRPPSGAPWFDQGWSTLFDDGAPAVGAAVIVARFCGWGLRWPRCFVGLGGSSTKPWLAQRVASWQGRRRRRRNAPYRRAFHDSTLTDGTSRADVAVWPSTLVRPDPTIVRRDGAL